MTRLRKGKDTPNFVPDYVARSLYDVDFEELKRRGVRYIAFDADSTLVHFRGTELSPKARNFLKNHRSSFKSWCIASNRPTNDLQDLGKSLDAVVIRAGLFTRKPWRRYFNKVLDHFESKPQDIAMIGDKLIADMWGAKRMGLQTVWVEKIGPDSPWDSLLQVRRWERWLIGKHIPKKGRR